MQADNIHKSRLKRLRALLKENEVEAFFTINMENIFYLTGFTGSSGILLVGKRGSTLFTDSRYTLQSKKEVKHSKIVIFKKSVQAFDMISAMKEKVVGFNAEKLTHKMYLHLEKVLKKKKLKNIVGAVESLRMVKDDHELAIIKRAVTRAKRSLKDTLASIKVGETEIAIKNRLETMLRENGFEKESFDTIVVSGKNSALIHGRPSSKRIKRGEYILIDFGGRYKNYCTDMTRTVMLGEPDRKQNEIYNVVKEAKKLAILEIRDGVSSKRVDAVARDYIKRAGYGDYFLHGLGHGIGLEVHESPRLSPNEDFILRSGMLVTVEPGIYLENFGGIRIEDMVYITDTGSKVLTRGSDNLIIQGK